MGYLPYSTGERRISEPSVSLYVGTWIDQKALDGIVVCIGTEKHQKRWIRTHMLHVWHIYLHLP